MKKQILKSALIAMAGVGLLASGAMALTVNPPASGEFALQTIVNSAVYDGTADSPIQAIDVQEDQSDVTAWTLGELNADAYLISLFTAGSGKLGIASATAPLDPTKQHTFNLGTSSTPGTSVGFWINEDDLYMETFNTITKILEPTKMLDDIGTSFTFYYELSNGKKYFVGSNHAVTYFVESGLNVKVPLHNATLSTGNNDWIFAFEDGTDGDFNDAVFYLEDIKPVPEPATMLLFGTGLAGLAAIGRRRKTQA